MGRISNRLLTLRGRTPNAMTQCPSLSSSWTCFRICERKRTSEGSWWNTSEGSRWDAETSSAWLYNEIISTPNCHPELVSGSVSGQGQEKLAVKHKCRLAVRCWNKFSMTLNSAWQFNDSKTMTKGNDNQCNRNNPNREIPTTFIGFPLVDMKPHP